MSESKLRQNARDLELELAWLTEVIDTRFKLYFDQECEVEKVSDLAPPDLATSSSPWARWVEENQLGFAERLALVLGLVPHLRPQVLDVFSIKNQSFDRPFTEFGGARREGQGDFRPSGETLAFLLAGNDLETRFRAQALFDPPHLFARHGMLRLEADGDEPPSMKSPLRLSRELLSLFTSGEPRRPDFGASFPARYIETRRSWDDLVLHPGTRKQVGEIETWIRHGDTLLNDWDMAAKLRPGYRSLFFGPPGTGKTTTACLLGKSTGRDVYQVDLSLVISKYIGETEKNLAKIFDQAQNKGWILFFDEADALFGKRSETKDAHDRYANQEVAFLLQRVETFDGIAILASNLQENIDSAFARRFESIIYFPMPRPEERLLLWRQGFSPKAKLADCLDLECIARDHKLSGSSIMNVVRWASLQALERGDDVITGEDVRQGIHKENAKEGKAA